MQAPEFHSHRSPVYGRGGMAASSQQAALDQPRFCLEDGNPSDAVALEEGILVRVMAALAEMGHPVRPVSGWGRALFGRGQVILREPEGTLIGGSDPRADGCAMTLAG